MHINLNSSMPGDDVQTEDASIQLQETDSKPKAEDLEVNIVEPSLTLQLDRENWLKSLTEAVSDCVVIKDNQGRWLIANESALKLFGLETIDYRGKTNAQMATNDNHYRNVLLNCAAADEETWQAGRVTINECRITLPDGSQPIFDIKKVPLFNSDGNRLGLVMVAKDITLHKQEQEQITFQSSLLNQVRNAVIATDLEGKIIYWNQFAESLYQWEARKVIGKDILELLIPEDNKSANQQIIKSIKNLSSWEGEFTAQRRDRSKFVAYIVNTVIRDTSGNPKGVVGVSIDITNRVAAEKELAAYRCRLEELVAERSCELIIMNKQLQQEIAERQRSEDALRESEYRYYTLAKMSPVGIFRTDAQGNYLYVNERWCEITGLTATEAMGKFWVEVIHPEERSRVFSEWYQSTQQQVQFNSEYRFQLPDGSKTWVFGQATLEKTNTGEVKGYVGTLTEITQRKQAEETLKKSEQKLSHHVQQTPLAVIEWNIDNEIVEWNPAAEAIFGYSRSEIIGCKREILVSKTRQEELTKLWDDLLQQKGSSRSTQENLTKDGRTIICEWYNTPLIDQNGDVIGVASMAQDITTRITTEAALRQQSEQERIISAIAHRICKSLKLEEILNTAVWEIQKWLSCDRVVIYRLWPEGTGSIVSEAVLPNWVALLDQTFPEEVFPEVSYQQYKSGQVRAIADIDNEDIAPCLVEFVQQFGVKAKLIAPLLQGEELWGLMIAHQCRNTRQWQTFEINLLQNLATQIASAIQQASLFEQLEAANRELQRQANIDGLTQVANRRSFDENLEREWRRMAREQQPLALILCDVDHFKNYNDHYGHLAGDLCLQQIASAIARAVKRPGDLVARYGGEEFAVILPNTKAEGALQVATEIRSIVASLQINHEVSSVGDYVTLSIGIALIVPHPQSSPDKLIHTADLALYEAKTQGRDRIILKTCRP